MNLLLKQEFTLPELVFMKPRREIYEAALESVDLKPEETVFIDDKEDHIISAREFRIHGFIFPVGMDLESFWNDTVLKKT